MRIATEALLKRAYGKYGVGAFNVFNAEQVLGIFRGANAARSPVIIQITPAARNYMSGSMFENIIQAAEKQYPDVDFSVHLDHGNYEHCIGAIDSGFYNSVMIDASLETIENNIRVTGEIVERAHDKGIAVEAELGILGGAEDHLSVEQKSALYTHPEKAAEFVSHTGCDSLAVAVGTSHGAYKFSPGDTLRLDILSDIRKRLPGFPLVLHGASAVSQSERERINRAGGQLKPDAKGINREDILKAIALGVCKINIATDIRLLWARIHREFFIQSPEKFDMILPGTEYMDALEQLVFKKCMEFKIN